VTAQAHHESHGHQDQAGKRSITAATAMRLARYFGSSARFWMNLQSYYDLAIAEEEFAGDVERNVQPREMTG
jgi:antitoxin HigA-1